MAAATDNSNNTINSTPRYGTKRNNWGRITSGNSGLKKGHPCTVPNGAKQYRSIPLIILHKPHTHNSNRAPVAWHFWHRKPSRPNNTAGYIVRYTTNKTPGSIHTYQGPMAI